MQFTIDNAIKANIIKKSVVSIPSSLSASVLNRDIELEACCCTSDLQRNAIMEIWDKQHPLIHTWLLLSSISICLLSALFFIFP